MTKYERETVITYNDEEDAATVYTCNAALIRKLDSFCLKSPLFNKAKSDSESATYTFPKKCVSIRLPRTLTEEKRAEMALRAKERFGYSKNEEVDGENQ